MKITVDIENISKPEVLNICTMGVEYKQVGNNIRIWYYAKLYWKEDLKEFYLKGLTSIKYKIYNEWI